MKRHRERHDRKRDKWCAPTKTGSRCSASASTIMVSCAPGANATTTSATRNDSSMVEHDHANIAAIAIATANEPKAAPR